MLWHEHVRRAVKLAYVAGLHYSGLLGRTRRALMRTHALILMYHRVAPPGWGPPDYSPVGMCVTPDEFAMQMRFVRRHYDVVPLARIVSAVRGAAPFAPGMCAVTFDDGWQDVYQYAFPILRGEGIPATVFLTSGYVDGTQWFWEERLKYLLALVHQRRLRDGRSAWTGMARTRLDAWSLAGVLDQSDATLPGFLLQTGRQAKAWRPERRDGALQTVEEVADGVAADAPRPFMTWSEARELSQHGIELGNHTTSHQVLPDLAGDDTARELREASDRIAEGAGCVPSALAYPYGKHDARVRQQAQDLGFESACTTEFGLVAPGADPYALNRINMCSAVAAVEPLFAARILGY